MDVVMIKVEAVYKDMGKAGKKFDHFKLTIGEHVFEPVPISYLRISELGTLEMLLQAAAEYGKNQFIHRFGNVG